MLIARFDPAADPWGTAMLACAALCAFAIVWAFVALLMRQPARGAGRLMSLGLLGYLVSAGGGTAARVRATPPAPPPAPAGPPVVIQADVPTESDPDGDAAPTEAKVAEAKVADAKVADAKVADAAPNDAAPTEPAPTEPAPTEAAPTEPAPTEPAPTEPAPTEPAPTEAAPAAVELGPPTLAGREALRFVDEVSHDADKCADAKQVAAAARELPGALAGVARARVEKAASRLEGCRRKVMWGRAYAIRRERVEAREQLAEALPARLREQGLSVLIALRGPAHERIRIGGTKLDAARAQALLDGGLRDELAGVGFTDITLTDNKGAVKETPEVPTDNALAERDLAALGLAQKITLP